MRGGALSTTEASELLDAGYKDIKDALHVGRWTLDTEISTKRSKVYVNEPTKKVYVVHAGTDSASDWLNNTVVFNTRYLNTKRYQAAAIVQSEALFKYGPIGTVFQGKVNTLSHSQGGGIVANLIKNGLAPFNNLTVNPAVIGHHKNLRVIRSNRDAVSLLSRPEISIGALSKNPLLEHSTDILKRIQKNLSDTERVSARKTGRRTGRATTRKSALKSAMRKWL